MSLDPFGWTPTLAQTFTTLSASSSLEPGRVVRQDRSLLKVQTAAGAVLAMPSGKLVSGAVTQEDLPVIGDWVAVTTGAADDTRHIMSILPRTSILLRRASGEEHRAQPMAANVDQVLIVVGLDKPLNARWLERSVTWVSNTGASACVVLNKADMSPDPAAAAEEARATLPGIDVVTVSALAGIGLAEVHGKLAPRRTAMMLGASGAGKSTLLNALLGDESQKTGPVRFADQKGRHTTTYRELHPLPGGALLVDIPGVRELGLWGEGEGLQDAFTDVAALASGCRFNDCAHEDEPGCAVRRAVEKGELTAERVQGFHKLQRELEALAAKTEARAQLEQKRSSRNKRGR